MLGRWRVVFALTATTWFDEEPNSDDRHQAADAARIIDGAKSFGEIEITMKKTLVPIQRTLVNRLCHACELQNGQANHHD